LSFALAIDLGGTNLRGALVDADGAILLRRETTTPKMGSALGEILSFARDLRAEAELTFGKPSGIGLALPGFLIRESSRIHFSPNLLPLAGIDVGGELSRTLSLPCVTENDGNCAALGEWWVGQGKGHRHVVTLMIGTGFGGGLISDGHLIRGFHGSGGEIGHICIDPDGPPCGCGSNGCLESFVSGTALTRETGLTGKRLFEMAEEGDGSALTTFSRMGRYLGTGIASLCFLFDPEVVTLGGKVSRSLRHFLPSLTSELDRRLQNHPAKSVRILMSAQEDDAGLLGAAWISFNRN
jgi:glucokinase